MAQPKYPTPDYSRREVNRAGATFVNPQSTPAEKDAALIVINNWRTAHNFPLNTFQMRLRKMTQRINPDSLVAQRIKRLASIKHKLERIPTLNLAQMQDLGGCRAIMKDVSEVDQLVNIYKKSSRGVKHSPHAEDDYISRPKDSGYRGIHLIYKYGSDKSKVYEGLKVEIQFRTLAQHAWATSVETVGTFIKQSLKSSQGEADWLRFFVVMSSAMAIIEGKPVVPETSENIEELKDEIRHLSNKLSVESHLTAFRQSIVVIGERKVPNAHYYLLELDPGERRITIKPYSSAQIETASRDYMLLEKRILDGDRDAVLVSADSIEALKLAFPNYYLDTEYFLRILNTLTTSSQLTLF